MELLFANWIDFNGTEHRMFNQCDNMRRRFRKFIEKSKERANSPVPQLNSQASSPGLSLESSMKKLSERGHVQFQLQAKSCSDYDQEVEEEAEEEVDDETSF